MHPLDLVLNSSIDLIRTPRVTEWVYLLTILFDITIFSVLVTACIAGLIYLVRGARYAMLFLVSIIVGAILVEMLKLAFNVARPTDGIISAFGQSFPSYHATIATIFFVILMYAFDDYLNSFGRIVFNTLCIILIFLVAASRVYLGVHWASDVLGGILLGVLVSYISISSFKWYNRRSTKYISN